VNECPYCKCNELVWCFTEGHVVCSNCGIVLDRIYDYTPLPKRSTVLENGSHNHSATLYSYETKIKRINHAYRNYEKLVKKYSRLRPGLRVKDEAMMLAYKGYKVKMVKMIVNEKTEEIKKEMLSSDKVFETILKEFTKYPRVASRTDRVKLALATIIYTEINKGIRPSFTGVAKRFGISIVNLRKAYNVLKKYKDLYENLRLILSKNGASVNEEICNQGNTKQIIVGSKI